MQQFQGKGIRRGIAAGRIFFCESGENSIRCKAVSNVAAEIERYEAAKAKASEQLQKLYDKAVNEVGEDEAAIFTVYRMLLEDGEYNNSVAGIIKSEKVCAEYAVAVTGDIFAEKFAVMDDDYLSNRSSDIKDISARLVRVLCERESAACPDEPVILVANELTPSDIMQIERQKLLAFVTQLGSTYSHTAILAGMMGLPYVTGIDIDKSWNGKKAVVDGYKGTVIIDPDDDYLNEMILINRQEEERRSFLKQLKGKAAVTKSGRNIHLYANAGSIGDIKAALDNGAEGIGLFRSEFLSIDSTEPPTEEEQFLAYRSVLQKMGDRLVVIRTFDLGADKHAGYLGLEKEANPALGYRGIRICLDRPDFFKTQLRAIYRASVYGNAAIMFPMIISSDEVRQCKKYVEEVKQELKTESIPFCDDVELGIMIETPAAAIISETLAKEVDFFSIGTNDLTQYTLAVDRQNTKLEAINDPYHPAVLELIRMTIENGHKGGVRVGICGELASDTTLTAKFIEYGIDELSVSPENILPLKAEILGVE